jgi:hypothetical protein
MQQLYQTVAELEPSQISPGQPNTYIPLLKRIAMELSPGGSFQLSSMSTTTEQSDPTKLVVTEAWCLFARPKPSSVWARDALAFADAIQKDAAASAATQINHACSFRLPLAAWSLTHGPVALEKVQAAYLQQKNEYDGSGLVNWMKQRITGQKKKTNIESVSKPLFPLPTSVAQNRIADLLLNHKYPVVVCEGPPGTGKTHSIANLICAYLCQGKRVLVTSKNAPALSVLRERLPASVRELCVDVSMSELSGMRQLQQTVERLADRICSVSSIVETEKCRYLLRNISDLENELVTIDEQLTTRIEKSRHIVGQPRGQRLIELSLLILETAPWIANQLTKWTLKEVSLLRDRVGRLIVGRTDSSQKVSGYEVPVSDALISMVASKAGSAFSVVKNSAEAALAVVPIVGAMSGMKDHLVSVQGMLSGLLLNETPPSRKADWIIVLKALTNAQAVCVFEEEVWRPFQRRGEWPKRNFWEQKNDLNELHTLLVYACEVKELACRLNVPGEIDAAIEARTSEARRGAIASRIHSLAEEVVDCTVVMELSRSFSVEAQSALIRFAQIAGKSKFSRTSQPSKMSQRQKRRRQEYLEAFDRCCRFIPCWILTTSQINDYLPSECLFDLVVCDEASQSEAVSVLPSMLRGEQWLIVGVSTGLRVRIEKWMILSRSLPSSLPLQLKDTKQVSPTDCFVSEDQVESLMASLPHSPFSGSFLPGQSFFDLCSQAFPLGRVVLSEHFRCTEEIIGFSNAQFYDGRLVPLRLPKKSERLKPPVLDVRVPNGVKTGKTNEIEADEIVRRIKAIVSTASTSSNPRSIGVISLIGDEQSRLIRGRLLDVVGPQIMSQHRILVGDPPTFQGAERDIIFLSLVASPGSVPTQSQLMHFQRANVALSRARDQCILVRSIDLKDIPSDDDVKVSILEFFENKEPESEDGLAASCPVQILLRKSLEQRGFLIRCMGVVWKNGLCVEQRDSDNRVALLVEGAGESQQQWQASFAQQKAIERVGWRCLRVDALSLLADFVNTFEGILKFLSVAGLDETVILYDALHSDEEDNELAVDNAERRLGDNGLKDSDVDIVVISSNDEDADDDDPHENPDIHLDYARPDIALSGNLEGPRNDDMDPSNFGQVVDLSFLAGRNGSIEPLEAGPLIATTPCMDYQRGDDSSQNSAEDFSQRPQKRQRRKRLDNYQPTTRWFPGKAKIDTCDDPEGQNHDWYDTDSDIAVHRKIPSKEDDASWNDKRR